MYRLLLYLLFFLPSFLIAQENERPLPKGYSDAELDLIDMGIRPTVPGARGITTPPDVAVRSMAEWEEMQAIVITWTSFTETLLEIVRYSVEEVEVIIVARPNQVAGIQATLISEGIPLNMVTILSDNYNSIWVRDYGANPVYANDVDSLYLVDWIYNRNRPRDDTIPEIIGDYLGVPVYETAEAPYDLVHTGGNYMSDGLGTAFSSDLLLEENGPDNFWGTSNHTEADVDAIMNEFMGIEEYIKFEALLYDGINHIDMHMKLLDEQTLLVGQFPEGVSDGPQIEANIAYLQDNFLTPFGTAYRVERIQQPPCGNGNYPPNCSIGAEYRTYTNALIVNKTILVPIYNNPDDDVALAKWRELKPGYKVRGIDCTDIINSGGAIHCITKEVGVNQPLWIAHGELPDLTAIENEGGNDYVVDAIVKHKAGIQSAILHWTYDTLQPYTAVDMALTSPTENIWSATIPHTLTEETVFYYIEATANDGKNQVRPLVAPEGTFSFNIEEPVNTTESNFEGIFDPVYPNPASGLTVIPLNLNRSMNIDILIVDVLGKTAMTVFSGEASAGKENFFFEADRLSSGNYFIVVKGDNIFGQQKLVVQ